MARLTPPTTDDLSEFSDIPEDDLSSYSTVALRQATLLFELATGLEAYPEVDSVGYDTAINGICDMALALYYGKDTAQARYSPYQSESIGSYSYSKVAAAIVRGLPTDVGWFDSAVALLSTGVDNSVGVYSDAVTVFEDDDSAIIDDRRYVLGPADMDTAPPWWRA